MTRSGQDRAARRSAGIVALAGFAALWIGCGGGGGGTTGPTPVATQTNAVLRGAQEATPVVTTAKGTATINVNAAVTQAVVTLQTTGLTNVTLAHIHVGPLGANGPIIFNLYTGAGVFPTTLTKTLTKNDLVAQPAQNINTFADAVNAINTGAAYINVHTAANPNGEIRGQVGPQSFTAALKGASEVPPTTVTQTGTAVAQVTEKQTEINVSLTTKAMTDVTLVQIHVGQPGANGPAIFTLFSSQNGSAFTSQAVQVKAANLTAQAAAGVSTFADAVNAIFTGNAYVNIHTVANPTGAIRGQLVPQ